MCVSEGFLMGLGSQKGTRWKGWQRQGSGETEDESVKFI